jgi:hypothetical protein
MVWWSGTSLTRNRWFELTTIVVATIAAVAGYAWLSRLGIDLADEGYFLDLASRVQAGELPYRDFDTYYTPGIFYLDGAVLSLFGENVLPPRLLMACARVGCALVGYVVARRLASPGFAAIPAIVIALLGMMVGPHPGWPALFATLVMIAVLTRANDSHARRWLVLAGAAGALAFLFKQNVGAFALLGAVGYVVLVSATEAGRLLLAVRASFAATLALVTYHFLAPLLDIKLGSAVWLPLVAIVIILVVWSRPVWNATFVGIDLLLRDVAALAVGASVVTAAWLVPLTLSLGVQHTPFSLFLGNVNQGALIFRLDGLPQSTALIGLIAVWTPLVVAGAFRPLTSVVRGPALVAVAVTPTVFLLPTRGIPLDPLTSEPEQLPRLAALDSELGSLLLYLPVLCALAAVLLLMKQRYRVPRPPPVACLVLVGALSKLGLFPRADTAHAILAGVPLVLVGGWVLDVIYTGLSRGVSLARKVAVFAALLIVPVSALAPHIYGRSITLRDGPHVPLGIDRAAVVLQPSEASPLRDAVAFVRDHTAPGDPLFAYPMDPLVNFLADRPNPTRFDHFLPGALSPADMRGVVADLEASRPRYVFWDHGSVVFWETDRANRVLSDYIWRCYTEAAAFRLYLVLERTPC